MHANLRRKRLRLSLLRKCRATESELARGIGRCARERGRRGIQEHTGVGEWLHSYLDPVILSPSAHHEILDIYRLVSGFSNNARMPVPNISRPTVRTSSTGRRSRRLPSRESSIPLRKRCLPMSQLLRGNNSTRPSTLLSRPSQPGRPSLSTRDGRPYMTL